MQIMGDLILYDLEYVLEVKYQYKPVEKYTNPMLFPMAYISVYTVTAGKFRIHLWDSNIIPSACEPKALPDCATAAINL